MANIRQYIGARYVFKIYENSQDPSSAEWEAGATYEPLTIVTYLNSTYASKKDVPGSVGNPAANPQYWIVTGAYNGQIAALQQQIDTINNTTIPNIDSAIQALTGSVATLNTDVQELKDITVDRANDIKRVIVIADSYGEVRGGNVPFVVPLQSVLGLANTDYYALTEGGMGFVQAGGLGNTALTLLQANENDVTDHDTITDIVFALGINDATSSESAIINAIETCVAYCKTTYKNARIHIGYINYEIRSTFYIDVYMSSLHAYINGAMSSGARYMNNIEYVMHNRTLFQSDKVHPTTEAGEILSKNIAQCLRSGSCDYKSEIFTGSAVDSSTGVTLSYQRGFIDDSIARLLMTLDFSQRITLSGYTWHTIGTFDGLPISPNPNAPVYFKVNVFTTDNNYDVVDGRFSDNMIQLNAYAYNSSKIIEASTTSGSILIIAPTISC